MFNDTSFYRTQTVKGDKGFVFNYSKIFSFAATEEVYIFFLIKMKLSA